MSARLASAAAQGPQGSRLRLANWLLIDFVLDVVSVVRGDRRLIDALLISAISQANVEPINQDARLQAAFADANAPPPDSLRRPISINAVAASLGLSFETVRRRARALEQAGLCVRSPQGLIVPTAAVTSPEYMRLGLQAYLRLRAFYDDLVRHELLPPLPAASVRLTADTFPLRLVARLTTGFFLRLIDEVQREFGDLCDGLLFLDLVRSSTRHLDARAAGDSWFGPELFGDDHRRPVSRAALARSLGLPAETVRRHVGNLMAAGYVVEKAGGLCVPQAVLQRPSAQRIMTGNLANLDRFFGQLAQLGVVDLWREQGPAS